MRFKRTIETVVVATLLMAALCAIATPALADYTTTRYISTGQEISFILDGSGRETVIVYYYPNEAGIREFEAWHATLYYWDKHAGMTFSWTDDDGQTWHEWRNAAIGFY